MLRESEHMKPGTTPPVSNDELFAHTKNENAAMYNATQPQPFCNILKEHMMLTGLQMWGTWGNRGYEVPPPNVIFHLRMAYKHYAHFIHKYSRIF